jgi:DNA-binding NarL/FixJ family response regulator
VTPGQPLRVLLVDDDAAVLEMLQAVLSARTFEVVGLAGNGADAIRVAAAIAPDVAVVDYMMPGMDGLEAARRIKAQHPDCRIVIFSALDMEHEAGRVPEVDHFLKKSDVLRLESLLTRIREDHGYRAQ